MCLGISKFYPHLLAAITLYPHGQFNIPQCDFAGAVLFNLHARDLIDQMQSLMTDMDQNKTPLWQQMRVVEIASAVLADKVMNNGCTINLEPEEIVWSDGTITKASPPPKGRGRKKKKPDLMSKNGIFSVIVRTYGPRGKDMQQVQPNVVVVQAANEVHATLSATQQNTPQNGRKGL